MAPLENGGFQPSVWDGDKSRPIDSLMRALLYVAQQVGRPLGEADVRRLAAVPAAGLDEQAFLTAGARLGLETQALDLTPDRLDDLPMPFALVAPGQPAHVVVTGRAGHWVVLDVVEGRAWRLSTEEVMALGTRALVMREKRPDERREAWYAPLWTRVRPVILKLAATSFVINVLGDMNVACLLDGRTCDRTHHVRRLLRGLEDLLERALGFVRDLDAAIDVVRAALDSGDRVLALSLDCLDEVCDLARAREGIGRHSPKSQSSYSNGLRVWVAAAPRHRVPGDAA